MASLVSDGSRLMTSGMALEWWRASPMKLRMPFRPLIETVSTGNQGCMISDAGRMPAQLAAVSAVRATVGPPGPGLTL